MSLKVCWETCQSARRFGWIQSAGTVVRHDIAKLRVVSGGGVPAVSRAFKEGPKPVLLFFRRKKTREFTLSWTSRVLKMVGRVGFEPTTNWLKANCSTNLANDPLRGGAYITDFSQ